MQVPGGVPIWRLSLDIQGGIGAWGEEYFWSAPVGAGASPLRALQALSAVRKPLTTANFAIAAVKGVAVQGAVGKFNSQLPGDGCGPCTAISFDKPSAISSEAMWDDLMFRAQDSDATHKRTFWVSGVPITFTAWTEDASGAVPTSGGPAMANWITFLSNKSRGAAVPGGVAPPPRFGGAGAAGGGAPAGVGGLTRGTGNAGTAPPGPGGATPGGVSAGGAWVIRGRSQLVSDTQPVQILSATGDATGCFMTLTLGSAPPTGGVKGGQGYNPGDRIQITKVRSCGKTINGDHTVVAVNATQAPYTITVSPKQCCCGPIPILPTGYIQRIVPAWFVIDAVFYRRVTKRDRGHSYKYGTKGKGKSCGCR